MRAYASFCAVVRARASSFCGPRRVPAAAKVDPSGVEELKAACTQREVQSIRLLGAAPATP